MGASSRGAPWRAGGCKSLNGSRRSGGRRGGRAPFRCALAAVRAQEGVSARKKTGRTVAGRGERWLRSGARRGGPSVPRWPVLRAACTPRVLRVQLDVPRALLRRGGWGSCETRVCVPLRAVLSPLRRALVSCRAVVLGASPLQSSPASLCNGLCVPLCGGLLPSPFSASAHTHTHAHPCSTSRAPRPRRSAGASLRRSRGSAPYRSAAPGGLPGRRPRGDGARGWGARPGGARGGVRA